MEDVFFFAKKRMIWGGWAGSCLEITKPNLSTVLYLLNGVKRFQNLAKLLH